MCMMRNKSKMLQIMSTLAIGAAAASGTAEMADAVIAALESE